MCDRDPSLGVGDHALFSLRDRYPRAIGRAGSAHHSLQEPGYRRDAVNPAISMASALWQADTPEPH
jgi:hypothetical protein